MIFLSNNESILDVDILECDEGIYKQTHTLTHQCALTLKEKHERITTKNERLRLNLTCISEEFIIQTILE